MKRLVRHMTYANVCATLALFVAVSSGTAVAARGGVWIDGRTIKPNSIPTRAYMNNSVTSAKLKNGQVRSIDIGNKQITAADVKNGSLGTNVLTPTTQRTLASVTGTGVCDGAANGECSPVDVVPSGVGGACRALGDTMIGKWERYDDGVWACQHRTDSGGTYLGNPAKAGALNGAINA